MIFTGPTGQIGRRWHTGPTGFTGPQGPTCAGGALGYYGSFFDTTKQTGTANTDSANGISIEHIHLELELLMQVFTIFNFLLK